jgi:hypothetical protein
MLPRVRFTFAARVLALLIALGAPAGADSGIDAIEHTFGATNINAVTGHGRLSVGVSADGDVTVLTWPSPSFTDQLGYLSSNDFHARSLPRLGAPEGAGLFLGLLIDRGAGTREVSWLRDRQRWQIAQDYGDDDGANIVTRHVSADLGLTVTVVDAVQPPSGAADVMVRRVTVERAAASPVVSLWLLTYANLSPTPPNSRLPELPVADWLFDGRNDFAAVWDASTDSLIHFHPNDQLVYGQLTNILFEPSVSYGPIGAQLKVGAPTPNALAQLVSGLGATYAPGAYAVLTTLPAPDQHQLGYDATPFCAMRDTLADNLLALPTLLPGVALPGDPSQIDTLFRCRSQTLVPQREGWTYQATDALADAGDGELEGSSIAAGEVNEALRTPLAFTDTGQGTSTATAAAVLGFGPRAADARAAVAAVNDAVAVVQAAAAALETWLSTVHLPESAPPVVQAVARRSLINLRVGTDAATGAIVASIARQPPYGLDWPRDGTFFNVALDVSGQSAVADRRTRLYVDWQRGAPVRPTALVDQPPPRDPTSGDASTYPADSWEMNYYPDGMVGGPIRFEIDNTALALWTIVTHVGWVSEPVPYLNDRWDAIARAADLLARWRDPLTGLQAPASEDDNAAYTQTLHGAVTVYGALDAAARAARLLGRDAGARRWEARACELRNAIVTHLYDATAQRFVSRADESFDPARAPLGETAWMVWPAHVFPWDDPRVDAQLRADFDLITPTVRLETPGGSYFMKSTVALGLARGGDMLLGPRITELRDFIGTMHPTAATHHFGESMLVEHDADGVHASQRVATPHLWEGILFYLTAMAIEDPTAFDRHDTILPASRVPPAGTACPATLPCAGDCNDDGAVSVDELMIGVNIALGNSAIEACTALDTSGDGQVTVAELIGAVNALLSGCPGQVETPGSA